MRRSRWWVVEVLVLTFVAVAGGAAVAAAPRDGTDAEDKKGASADAKKGIDADADRMLHQMTDYLAGLQSFTVRTTAMDETAMKSGEKIQTLRSSEVSVTRPNRLRATQRGSETGVGIWYDGKTMSVACKANSSYQTIPAPPNLDQAIDKMRMEFDIDAPGADLIYSRPYDILTEQVVSGRFIGKESLDGVPVNHLAFKGEEVDLQLWIQDGAQPLPRRYVITTKTVKGNPQFAVVFSDWNTQPNLPASTFEFHAAPDAKGAKAVVSSCGVSP